MPPAPRASGEAEGGPANDAPGRDVAHRHHRHPPARWHPRLSPRGDRQLLRDGFWPGGWRETFAPVTSVAVLLEASRRATASDTTPVVLADAGVENVNAQIDALISHGCPPPSAGSSPQSTFSNSMIEAWWRSLKHQWLFLHALDSLATVRRLVTFYVDEHNRALPHSAFRGQTPDEMGFGTQDAVPADLSARAAAARRARGEANRSAACAACPAVDAAA